MRKFAYTILHPLYENGLTKRFVPQFINLFKPDYVDVNGHRIYIDKEDRVISAELILSRKWEKYEAQLFEQSIHSGDTVLDVGAHIGYYTLIAARKVGPNGKVYAFEPLKKNFDLLTKNIKANNYHNVVLINKAVTNKVGSTKLYLSTEDNFGDQRAYSTPERSDFLMIQSTTIDATLKKNRVEVIKMDIQGSEILALQGAKQVLRQQVLHTIFMECWPEALMQSGHSAKDLLELLKKHKFSIKRIDSGAGRLTPLPNNFSDSIDLMCVKK